MRLSERYNYVWRVAAAAGTGRKTPMSSVTHAIPSQLYAERAVPSVPGGGRGASLIAGQRWLRAAAESDHQVANQQLLTVWGRALVPIV